LATFDDGHEGWAANRGTLGAAEEVADRVRGRAALRWRFEYVKESVFLFTRSGLDTMAGAQGLEVWLKSDREGPLFLRLDQADGAAFFVVFQVGREWSQHRFGFDDFKPASGRGRLVPDRVAALYLVDLGGQDRGQTGHRTIFVDDITITGALARDAVGDDGSGAGLVLRAYDVSGVLRSTEAWARLGRSGGEFVFASDLEGGAAEGRLVSSTVAGVSVPRLVIPEGATVAVQVLFWPVEGGGVRWLQADAAGRGYQGAAELNLNYELARSKLAEIEAPLRSLAPAPAAEPDARVATARVFIDRARAAANEPERAALADRALALLLPAADDRQLAQARADIPGVRMGDLAVTVRDGGERPIAGARVEYVQEQSAFRFGCAQSFGFLDHPPGDRINEIVDLMAAAGFNHFTIPLFWDRIEPAPGAMDLDAWDRALGVEAFHARGFRFTGHAIMQRALPDHVMRADADQLFRRAITHFERIVARYRDRYAGAVEIWEAINEPSSNRYVGLNLDARVALIQSISAAIRRADPRARVQVNDVDWDRGQRFRATALQTDLRELISTYDLFSLLNARNTDYDVLGLEWYPGLRVNYGGGIIDLSEPLQDLAATSRVWDRLSRLGKPIHVTEFAVPGTTRSGWRNGYWKEPWSSTAQAEFVSALLTLAYSKPYIHELTYWGITDHEPWALGGGLLDSQYQPKPVYEAIKALIASWTSRGSLATDLDGKASIRGHAGDYRVTVTHAGRTRTTTVKIDAGTGRHLQIAL